MAEDADLLKRIIRAEKDNGRSLFYLDSYRALAALMQTIGTDIATSESDWWEMRERVLKSKAVTLSLIHI